MDLEIHGARHAAQTVQEARRTHQTEPIERDDAKEVARRIADQAAERSRASSTRQYIDDIVNYAQYFNKRLKFSVNEELEQVVVKVIDAQTDKVIKEIPPEVLQRLHVRIREAIGLLIDESI